MHELSIAAALIDQARAAMAGSRARELLCLRVEVGTLCGVDAQALACCFPLAVRGTELAGARLELSSVATEVRCEGCGELSQPELPWLRCVECGGDQTRVVQGRDLILASLEVR